MDTLSKSDPLCIVYLKETGMDRYSELGRTEMIKDSLNPQWIRKVEVDYRFEERQVGQGERVELKKSSIMNTRNSFPVAVI